VTATQVRRRLRALARKEFVPILRRFFKTGPGEYGEGDVFLGVRLPQLRRLSGECRGMPRSQVTRLLRSRFHEERLLALLILVDAFRRGSTVERGQIYKLYLANTRFINNWDLVDVSAYHIVGAWLQDRTRAPLRRLARSPLVWDRRIAIMATFHFIRRREFHDTFQIADMLIGDPHDLIQKAVGGCCEKWGTGIQRRNVDFSNRATHACRARCSGTRLRSSPNESGADI
jgi:3-methyladenine DNA glycosylase AlkD